MSYILEALKKAQAERQIGETPTIHAPTLAPAAAGRPAGSRRALLAGVGVLGGAVVVMGAMLLRQQPQSQQPLQAQQPQPGVSATSLTTVATPTATATSAAQPSPAVSPTSAAQPPLAQPADVARVGAQSVAQTSASPEQAVAPSERTVRSAPLSTDLAQSAEARTSLSGKPSGAKAVATSGDKRAARLADAGEPAAATAVAPASAAAQAPAPASAAAAQAPAAQDEHIQTRLELPEPIQRAIPPITMGGYMYSKNPADRLILIDKVLRKEGDEVAPGLQLEKLQPKAAIFMFRGYRYKVPL